MNELEAELAEQTHLKQQALGESEFLRAELDDLRRVKEDTEKEQRSLSEIESKRNRSYLVLLYKEQIKSPSLHGHPVILEILNLCNAILQTQIVTFFLFRTEQS